MGDRGSKVLIVSTDQPKGAPVLQIAIESRRTGRPEDNSPDTQAEPEDSVALSACQGIIQEHRGRIVYDHREDGAIRLRVELPATESLPPRSKDSTVPVLWQSRPFA